MSVMHLGLGEYISKSGISIFAEELFFFYFLPKKKWKKDLQYANINFSKPYFIFRTTPPFRPYTQKQGNCF